MKLQKFQLGGVQTKKLESNDATPFMNFFKFLVPGFKQAYDQKLAQQNYDAKMKAQYRIRVPLQETPESIYKPKVQLAKKPQSSVAQNKPITKHQFGDKLPTAQSAEQRYRNGTRSQVASKYYGDSVSIRGVTGPSEWYQKPPIILEKIRHDRVNPAYNDTTYAEQPAYTPPIRVQERAAGNNILLQGKKQRFNFFGNFFNANYNPSTPQEQNEYDTLKRRFNTAWSVAKHQEGGQFKENLNPPSRGFFDSMKSNLQQGNEIMGKIVGSLPMQILGFGIGAGIGGTQGPTMKVGRTVRELVSNPRNAIRKFSRNLNARKGDPTYRWTRTSGDIRRGGATDYQFQGMGNNTRMKVNRAGRSEGSGYSAQFQLNNNPTYQKASSPAQTPMQRTWNNQRAEPIEWQASRRVMQRNNLIDQARDWRNYIFENPKFGWANFKVIPK